MRGLRRELLGVRTMRKRVIRHFFSFFETQEEWLNNMAAQGWRLVKVGRFDYEFQSCQPNQYVYGVEFVGDKSYREAKEYRAFLEELGYQTFTKNLNINYSLGKLRWRPYAKKAGQIATNPGSFNRELIIVEKVNDGKPLQLHSDYQDLIQYYKPIRNLYVWGVLFCLFLAIGSSIPGLFMIPVNQVGTVILGVVSVILLLPIIKYTQLIRKYKELSITNE